MKKDDKKQIEETQKQNLETTSTSAQRQKQKKRKKEKEKSQFLPRFAIVQTKLEEKIERHCKEKVWLLEKFTTYI